MNAAAGLSVATIVMFGATGGALALARARRTQATAMLVARLHDGRVASRPRRTLRARWSAPPAWAVTRFEALELPLRVDDVWRWFRVVAVAAPLAGACVAGPVLALVVAAIVCGVPLAAEALWRSRQVAAYDATLAAALDAAARSLRSGASLSAAVREAATSVRGAVAMDLQRVSASVARGRPLRAALLDYGERRPRPSVRLAVGAFVMAAESGGPPARVIEEVAGAVRARLQVEGEARALAAQARLSALVVGLAPIGFVALMSATDARNAHTLFATPVGVACLLAGLVLDAVGALWMHRLSESVVG